MLSEECQTSNSSSAYTHLHVNDSTDLYTYWTILGTLNGTLKRRLFTGLTTAVSPAIEVGAVTLPDSCWELLLPALTAPVVL